MKKRGEGSQQRHEGAGEGGGEEGRGGGVGSTLWAAEADPPFQQQTDVRAC